MFVCMCLTLFVIIYSIDIKHGAPIINDNLHTWWHDNIEYNDNSPVQDNYVRGSTIYNIQVATTVNETDVYDSFAYMSIPRGGRDKWEYSDSDGAEFAKAAKLTMSWSTFQYLVDVWVIVKFHNISRAISSIDDVITRPTNLNFKKELLDNITIRILVPYRPIGYRFSVEYKQDLFTTYSLNGNPTEDPSGQAVHIEPRNALLIFAESILVGSDIDRYIPNPSNNTIYYVPQGEVSNLNSINASVVYFKPGIYYMPWNYHAFLPDNVQWIYLSPGAHLKGAFQFQSADDLKVTGFGVLSGEKYVYEADTNNSYHHTVNNQCWLTCLKMLRFNSSLAKEQHLDLHGITISEPPYYSFIVYGDEQTFHMSVQFYHQVASWYWQTDGIEIYPGSTMKNCFLHSNDDMLKIYHSNVVVNNITIWKSENGPVIQWGWAPRNICNITIDQVDIIHSRIWWSAIVHNTCLINSATYYADTESTNTADPNQLIRNLFISNIRSEGMNTCAMRIYSLSSFQSITIENLWIEQWNQLDIHSQASLFKAYTDKQGNPVKIGNQSKDKQGLAILNYTIGTVQVSRKNDNWQDIRIGRLDFDGSLWDNWDVSERSAFTHDELLQCKGRSDR